MNDDEACYYQKYGLDPFVDFSMDKSFTRRQLNLLRYYHNDIRPWDDQAFPKVFSESESLLLEAMSRTTINGLLCHGFYLASAKRYGACPYYRTRADSYAPLINRIIKNKREYKHQYDELYSNVEDAYRRHINDIKVIKNKIIEALDKKYVLHYGTKTALGYEPIAYEVSRIYHKEDESRVPCTVCGRLHSNKIVYNYVRIGIKNVQIYECTFGRSESVLPYCANCAEIYMRRKAKEDYKVEKAAKEAREIGSLVRKIKQEIKSNGNKN